VPYVSWYVSSKVHLSCFTVTTSGPLVRGPSSAITPIHAEPNHQSQGRQTAVICTHQNGWLLHKHSALELLHTDVICCCTPLCSALSLGRPAHSTRSASRRCTSHADVHHAEVWIIIIIIMLMYTDWPRHTEQVNTLFRHNPQAGKQEASSTRSQQAHYGHNCCIWPRRAWHVTHTHPIAFTQLIDKPQMSRHNTSVPLVNL